MPVMGKSTSKSLLVKGLLCYLSTARCVASPAHICMILQQHHWPWTKPSLQASLNFIFKYLQSGIVSKSCLFIFFITSSIFHVGRLVSVPSSKLMTAWLVWEDWIHLQHLCSISFLWLVSLVRWEYHCCCPVNLESWLHCLLHFEHVLWHR